MAGGNANAGRRIGAAVVQRTGLAWGSPDAGCGSVRRPGAVLRPEEQVEVAAQ